jgi:ubiquinone/menaquinone biosynthesis C-methylase UbiE
MARQIADHGAHVTAIDHSKQFINRARERAADYGDELEFKVINAADMDALLDLGEQSFDAAVITMAIMDIAVISTPIAALAKLLRPRGRAVFSVTHPAFNSADFKLHAERGERDGRVSHAHRVSISRYNTSYSYKGEGVMGQPAAQWYFHRSMSTLVAAWANEGFMVDAIAEPSIPASDTTNRNALSWSNLPDVPPILVMRLRLP